MSKRKFRYRRTDYIKLTNEAMLLRQVREQCGFSIREVGRRLEKSETYVRHIEKGRMNIPSDEDLQLILDLYGMSLRQFKAKAINFKSDDLNRDYLLCFISKANDKDLGKIRTFVDSCINDH